MPLKSGRMTQKERVFASAYANSGSIQTATKAAGYVNPVSGYATLERPGVQAEIARIQTARLFNEILPLAIEAHIEVLTSPHTPPGARVQAVKLAYDRTLGADGASSDKQPHEMSSDELARAIADARLRAATLESVKADRAKPVIEAGPSDIFA